MTTNVPPVTPMWILYAFIATIVGSAVISMFTGCVSISKYHRDIKQTRIETFQKARKIAHWQKCYNAVQIISGRIDLEEMKK